MRILISRLSAIGDIVHAWPMVTELRRARPEAAVAWLVEEPLLPLVAGHPDVAEAIPVATRRWRRSPLAGTTRREISRTVSRIAGFAPEVALDPQGLLKSAAWAAVARVPRRIGFPSPLLRERAAGIFYSETVTPPASLRHVIDLNLSMLEALHLDPPYGAVPDGSFLYPGGHRVGDVGSLPVGLLPAAGAAEKLWASDRWGDLAAAVAAAGLRPLVVWGPGEEELARAVVERSSGTAEMAPQTTLQELCVLLSRCRAVVGGDTGPLHLAASLGTPVLAIHVATDPERNGPRGCRVNVVTGAAAASGVGRRARTGRAREVPVAEVSSALLALLEDGR